MRIRFWLYLTFGIFSIIPLLMMGYWAHNNLVQNEISRAGKAQLSLAETHADTIDRYFARQITGFENYVSELARADFKSPEFITDTGDDIERLIVVNKASGMVEASFAVHTPYRKDALKGTILNPGQLALFRNAEGADTVAITPLVKHNAGENCFYLVKHVGDLIIAGEIGTGFFVSLANGTRIGASGHAAIFDGLGNLVAHPNPDWQAIAKNIGKLEPVKLATAGKQGVITFHSPAMNAEMLAGVTGINRSGWGIMIPRTLADVTSNSGFAKRSAAFGFTLVMAAILLGSIIVSNFISRPIERLAKQVKRVSNGGDLSQIKPNPKANMPMENLELEKSFGEMVANLRLTHEKMKVLAYSDSVTKLPNREAFGNIVDKSLAYMANKDMAGAMLFVDIERFKEINDSLGHSIGDQVLRCIGARFGSVLELATGEEPSKLLEDCVSDSGAPRACVARFGGDEFVLFVPENNGLTKLEQICEQLLEAIETPVPGLTTNTKLKGHIGIASFPEHGLTCVDLIKKADIAVFHAKNIGRKRVQRYGDGTGELSATEMRRAIHAAIINNEMELYYQPKVNTLTNEINGVEALVRWFHPKKGLISPADFIPVIENSDITNELGEWVVKRACRDMKLWESQGHVLNIAVNIAARQFVSEKFVERIYQIVVEEDCDPMRFEIEVTEETALASSNNAHSVISQLHELGFKVSLDDYGRGYSNLSRLSELRVNTIKIDGPLTARLTRDERTRVIFEATINMARGLDCETVAEGVETAEEVAILSKLGCTELQGFYFATPLPRDGLAKWIEQRQLSPVKDLQDSIKVAI